MAYTLDESCLRVVRQLSRADQHSQIIGNVRLILLEHILPTTEEFIRHLTDVGAVVHSLLAKPYSIDPAVLQRLRSAGIPIEHKSYKELDESQFLDNLLHTAAERSRADGRKIVIVDVGGYFALPLTRINKEDAAEFHGVVEDTTFGHNRYISCIESIPVPVFSVARSALKEIEARFVGKDAVAAMELLLRGSGVSLPGRNALVIGYGMIGRNVARSLKAMDLRVSVYDQQDHKNLAAFINGYHIHKKEELLKHADIIYVATGNPKGALSFHEIEDCKDNVILVSVGSRDTEFDVQAVIRQSLERKPIGPDLITYKLHNSNVIIARNGTAINFSLPSIPTEVLDLVFSEILSCMLALIKNPANFALGEVHDTSDEILGAISKGWLRNVNR